MIGILAGVSALVAAIPTAAATGPFIDPFNSVQTIAPTVPKHGDVNPYGVAVVPVSRANLVAGDVLVSNFNNHRNLQGTAAPSSRSRPGEGRPSSHRSLRTSCRVPAPVGWA